MIKKELPLLLIIMVILGQCTPKIQKKFSIPSQKSQPIEVVNYPKREFRAAWVATVENIDWPSKRNLSSDQQQKEFISILNSHQKTGINAVLVQVRAASDAFYSRSTEPWSEWLTGEQGKAPEPYYDPMRFMIEEAHSRNMEFHAWLNLNRGQSRSTKLVARNSPTVVHPEWFMTYDGMKIYNFGLPEVREYITEVVVNIVKLYDVDGIHLDDYFYPYTVTGQVLSDKPTFARYGKGFNSIEDWRRNNINLLIKNIYKRIEAEKKWVKFGISPFSVWRNSDIDKSGSNTQAGQTSYDNLYADTKKWAEEGWVDYLAPQIYFAFEHPKVPYKALSDWWSTNHGKRHLYIGHSVYKIDPSSLDENWKSPSQLPRQIQYNRSNSEISGSIFYNTNSMISNKLGFVDSLKKSYTYPSLQPVMHWKDNIAPFAPLKVEAKKLNETTAIITWQMPLKIAKDKDEIQSFVIYRFEENENLNVENPSKIVSIVRNAGILSFTDNTLFKRLNYYYIVTALDRLHNESPASEPFLLK